MKRFVFFLALAVISINANANKQIKRAVNKARQFAKENKISIMSGTWYLTHSLK